jgi:hypothetical protein
MIQMLHATQFQRFMTSGRTAPAIFGCEDASGTWAGEYVVKLRGGLDSGASGLMRELVGSRLATYFGMNTPEPAVIAIEPVLAELIAKAQSLHAVRILGSAGLNFGTRLVAGFSTWPVDKFIPEAMWQTAADIFTFDALIQNPDRRYDNPNLFTRGDAVFVYDHEIAFSFLLALLPSPTPWKLDTQPYLTNHVFYRKLKSKPIDITGFTELLSGFSDAQLSEVTADVPPEWNNGDVLKIESHLRAMRVHAEEFAEEVRRILV